MKFQRVPATLTCPRCGGDRSCASVKDLGEGSWRAHLRCDDCSLSLKVTVEAKAFREAFTEAFARVAEGPVHGEERNRRFEALSSSSTAYVDAAGGEHTLLGSSREADVSERFCEPCGKWVECGKGGLGLIGHMICEECGAEWS